MAILELIWFVKLSGCRVWKLRIVDSDYFNVLDSLKFALTNVAVCSGRECLVDAYY